MPCGSQGRYAPRASRTVAKPNASEFPNGRFHDREQALFETPAREDPVDRHRLKILRERNQ